MVVFVLSPFKPTLIQGTLKKNTPICGVSQNFGPQNGGWFPLECPSPSKNGFAIVFVFPDAGKIAGLKLPQLRRQVLGAGPGRRLAPGLGFEPFAVGGHFLGLVSREARKKPNRLKGTSPSQVPDLWMGYFVGMSLGWEICYTHVLVRGGPNGAQTRFAWSLPMHF